MPEATNTTTTPPTTPHPVTSVTPKKRGLSVAQAAKHSFKGLGILEMPDRATFMEHAGNAYGTVSYAALMLRLSSAEMAEAFRKITEEEKDDGLAALAAIRTFSDTKLWFEGYAKTLEVIEARGFIAISQMAVAS
jgi:hypothetical protein